MGAAVLVATSCCGKFNQRTQLLLQWSTGFHWAANANISLGKRSFIMMWWLLFCFFPSTCPWVVPTGHMCMCQKGHGHIEPWQHILCWAEMLFCFGALSLPFCGHKEFLHESPCVWCVHGLTIWKQISHVYSRCDQHMCMWAQKKGLFQHSATAIKTRVARLAYYVLNWLLLEHRKCVIIGLSTFGYFMTSLDINIMYDNIASDTVMITRPQVLMTPTSTTTLERII